MNAGMCVNSISFLISIISLESVDSIIDTVDYRQGWLR